jgi:uncharacterized membrane protein SpoIIM required for sporulation
VRLDRFTAEREPQWRELEDLLKRAGGKPERLGPDGVRRLARLYRSAAADLAQARRSFPGDPIVRRLESLVTRARPVVYSSDARRAPLRDFLVSGYWRRVREGPRFLVGAVMLMLLPGVLAALWASSDPGAAVGLLPEQFRHAGDAGGGGLLSGGDQAAFASGIFTNNIRVTFLVFAGGVLFGLGTAVVSVYNGVVIGTVVGLASGAGNGAAVVELVAPHGFLELSCIAVAGAAGFRVGLAVIDPAPRTRVAALVAEARVGAEVVLGTMPWLVVAGLVEGFVTPRRIGVPLALAVGIALAAVYWGLVLWRGKPAASAAAAIARSGGGSARASGGGSGPSPPGGPSGGSAARPAGGSAPGRPGGSGPPGGSAPAPTAAPAPSP